MAVSARQEVAVVVAGFTRCRPNAQCFHAQPLLAAKITHVNTTDKFYNFTVLSLLTLSKLLRDLVS